MADPQKRRVPSQERVFLYRFLRISGECHSPPSIDHTWAIKKVTTTAVTFTFFFSRAIRLPQ
jgi:hypothetical protein